VSTGRQSGRGGVADAGQGEPNTDIQDCGMRVTTKIIKPKKIKDAAMRAALVKAVFDTGKEIDDLFALTYKTFDRKPEFVTENKDDPARISSAVYTTNQIYAWINNGTKKDYPITPKKPGGVLAFPSTFKPKSRRRGGLEAMAGYKSKKMRFAAAVIHPGIDARNFDKRIEKKVMPNFKKRVTAAMREAANDSGHAI